MSTPTLSATPPPSTPISDAARLAHRLCDIEPIALPGGRWRVLVTVKDTGKTLFTTNSRLSREKALTEASERLTRLATTHPQFFA